MRILVTGWPSFRHGEATAGDVASMSQVSVWLRERGIDHDLAWSPKLHPNGPSLDTVDPGRYSHLVFVCGPVHGEQIRQLHARFAHCRRLAIGVSIVDFSDAAVVGFHQVLPRDRPGQATIPDLAWTVARRPARVPVVGVVLAPEQPEYTDRRRHAEVHAQLRSWLAEQDCAPVDIDTRLDTTDGAHCTTPERCAALFGRVDLVLTTRLHGVVFGLGQGKPVLAVDPVFGGAKVAAQAASVRWPAVLTADQLDTARLTHWWQWCRSLSGTGRARRYAQGTAEPLRPEEFDALLGLAEGVTQR